MTDVINILHLSDLHFGVEKHKKWTKDHASVVAERNKMADEIVNKLNKRNIIIDLLVITGDIAWSADEKEYDLALAWLSKLRDNLGLDKNDIVVCPGNHDIDKESAIQLSDILTARDASIILSDIGNKPFEQVFKSYTEFCKNLLDYRYKYACKEVDHYLFGTTQKKGLRFMCFNSAWNCRFRKDNSDKGVSDRGKLWLGRPHLDVMQNHDGIFSIENPLSNEIVISMFHHPREWFHEDEQYIFFQSTVKPAYDGVVDCSHIILNGHVHANASLPDTHKQHSLVYVGGTTYSSSERQSFSSFSVLSINKIKRTIVQIPFTFINGMLLPLDEYKCDLFSASNNNSSWGEPSRLELYRNIGEIRNAEDNARNIPLKTDTFNKIFDAIRFSNSSGSCLVFECGYKGGKRFGESINETEIPSEEKISRWCEFDTAAGWGKFSHTITFDKDSGTITGELTIENCFQSNDNCDYVRGYCTGVLEMITSLNIVLSLCEDDSIVKFKVDVKSIDT